MYVFLHTQRALASLRGGEHLPSLIVCDVFVGVFYPFFLPSVSLSHTIFQRKYLKESHKNFLKVVLKVIFPVK